MEYEVLIEETGEIIGIENIVNLQQLKSALAAELEQEAAGFVRIGFLLKRARETQMFCEEGYENIYDFAKETYGLDRSTVSRFIAINDRYSRGGNSAYLEEKYTGYGRTKLQEMLTIPTELAEEIRPETTKREIQELKKEIKEEKEEQKNEKIIENTTREEDSEKRNLKEKLENNTKELQENTQKTKESCDNTQKEVKSEEEKEVAPVQQIIENTTRETISKEEKITLKYVIENLFQKEEWKIKMTEINKAVWKWKETKDIEQIGIAISKTGYAHARIKRAYIFFHTADEGIVITHGADKKNVTYQEFAMEYDEIYNPGKKETGEETYRRYYGEETIDELKEKQEEKQETEQIPGQMQINDYEECIPEELKKEETEEEIEEEIKQEQMTVEDALEIIENLKERLGNEKEVKAIKVIIDFVNRLGEEQE